MFNMGGPIKQGIMTGIREPHASGGRAALVGNPIYPKTAGREHHFAAKVAQVAAPRIIPKVMPHIKRGLETFKNWFGKTKPTNVDIGHKIKWRAPVTGHQRGYTGTAKPGGWERGAPITETQNIFTASPLAAKAGKYLSASPEGKAAKWIWDGKGWVAKAAAMPFKSPLVAAGLTYTGVKWIWPDGTPASKDEIKEIKKSGGDKDYGPHTKGGPTITQEQRDAKAKADKEKRINALLDTMGYDKARKNAAYDALIDAGRMVSERGTLDPKNIGRELIDPIAAATSQRFDKPEQIREAVGLMQVKADIQKEMTKDETELANKVKRMNLRIGEKTLAGATLEETAEAFFAKHGQWPSGELLGNLARNKDIDITEVVDTSTTATGLKDIGDPVEFMEGRIKKFKEKGIEIPPGNYVVEDAIIIIDAEGNVRRR